MRMTVNQWRPAHCGCVIQYEFDSDSDAETRTHVHKSTVKT